MLYIKSGHIRYNCQIVQNSQIINKHKICSPILEEGKNSSSIHIQSFNYNETSSYEPYEDSLKEKNRHFKALVTPNTEIC